MRTRSFDVIVLGLGGVGSAACHALSRRGARVLGIEQHARGHALGSSHGETRLTRKSYLARPEYIPLLHASERRWEEIGAALGRELLVRTGHVVVALPGTPAMPRHAARVAAEHGVRIESLSPAEASARFPGLRVPEGYEAYVEPGAGYLAVERCVEACCVLAESFGATLRFDEAATSWAADGDGVQVKTARSTFRANALVICGGAWSAELLRALALPLVVERIPQLWFAGAPVHEVRRGMPCFLFELAEGTFYGVPSLRDGRVKVCGSSRPRAVVDDPSRLDRALHEDDLVDVRAFIERCLPALSPELAGSSMCMDAMTPDARFVVGAHPRHDRIFFAAGLSGHGFKLAPVLGEELARRCFSRALEPRLDLFDLGDRAAGIDAEPRWSR